MLGIVSTVFGMMMAVAQDLPELENRKEFDEARNSAVLDAHGRQIATMTGNENRILVESSEISQNMKQAIVAVEDRRFYEHTGVDYRGIARALVQDIRQREASQGGSTITQQFVKNALSAQGERTVFQKLRESALSYHLERKWSKDKILTQYLNTIYFGEGAYGVEAAARTYFGEFHPGCGESRQPKCASVLLPHEAALLAGVIASPSRFSPRQNASAALARRNLVLQQMHRSGLLSGLEYRESRGQALPAPADIEPPREDSKAPYFTSWLRQQLVDRYGAGRAFGGGLRIRTTVDLELQKAAEEAVNRRLGGIGPTASIVVLDNKTAGVRAMVGGSDFRKQPFNLATNGHRQPGSAFKPFILVRALETGRTGSSVYTSRKKVFDVPGSPGEKFEVNNYEDRYAGVTTLANATAFSDNSVYAELGVKTLGTRSIARTARKMGIRTPVSTNPAMTLGGLKQGLTTLELAHSYETLATGGRRVSGTLASSPGGPVAISTVQDADGEEIGENRPRYERAIPQGVAKHATDILKLVVARGTGKAASYGGFAAGKTGTTENYGDAWFVGYTEDITVAVWVGYPNSNKPMLTEYGGKPVAGGTYPAQIWRDVVMAFTGIKDRRAAEREREEAARKAAEEGEESGGEPVSPAPTPEPQAEPEAPATTPRPEGGNTQQAPQEQEDEAPAEPAEPEPQEGTGGGGGAPPPAEAPSQPGTAPQQQTRQQQGGAAPTS